MIVKNKTDRAEKIGDVVIWAWRTEFVPDDSVVDETIFEIEKGEIEKKPKFNPDLNNDGKFDKADKTIAAKTLKQKVK